MAGIALVTDSTADIPADLARELRIGIVPASIAFDDRTIPDGALRPEEFYERLADAAHPPRPFGANGPGFRRAFEDALKSANAVLTLLMPFDVSASLTAAASTVLGMEPGAPIKVVNPGVASAGLGALTISLAAGIITGMTLADVLAWVEAHGPQCDTIFVPASTDWLARSGRLALIEQKTGPFEEQSLLVRVGTRITAAGVVEDEAAALRRAVEVAGKRAGVSEPVVVVIDHAIAPGRAVALEALARETLNVAQLVVTELSPTVGSQLGPGTVGIGVAPVAAQRGGEDDA